MDKVGLGNRRNDRPTLLSSQARISHCGTPSYTAACCPASPSASASVISGTLGHSILHTAYSRSILREYCKRNSPVFDILDHTNYVSSGYFSSIGFSVVRTGRRHTECATSCPRRQVRLAGRPACRARGARWLGGKALADRAAVRHQHPRCLRDGLLGHAAGLRHGALRPRQRARSCLPPGPAQPEFQLVSSANVSTDKACAPRCRRALIRPAVGQIWKVCVTANLVSGLFEIAGAIPCIPSARQTKRHHACCQPQNFVCI